MSPAIPVFFLPLSSGSSRYPFSLVFSRSCPFYMHTYRFTRLTVRHVILRPGQQFFSSPTGRWWWRGWWREREKEEKKQGRRRGRRGGRGRRPRLDEASTITRS